MAAFAIPTHKNSKKWTCPHCGRQLDAYRKPKHAPACPKQPAMLERLKAVLPDPSNPGVIIPFNIYRSLSVGNPELPSVTIMESTWGDWSDVAHAFGLITDGEFEQATGIAGLLPATIAELKRLSNELYDGIIGPSLSDYQDLADRSTGAQADNTIYRKFGTWEAALAAVGLVHESGEFYWQARKDRRKQRQTQEDREAAFDAPIGPDERLTVPEIPERPIPVIAAHKLPDGKGTLYKLGKLPDDWAPRVYGHVIAAVVDAPREIRYILK